MAPVPGFYSYQRTQRHLVNFFFAFHVVLKFLEVSDLLPYSSILFFSIQDIDRIQRENIRKTVHRHVLLLLGPFGVLAFSCSSLIEPSK